jgi:hypothetical protein
MKDKAKDATLEFERLCGTYVYPATPNTKDELIEFWSAGIAAAAETPADHKALEQISNRMQEYARNSRLYQKYPALEELNDDLLSFEDMDFLSENEEASVVSWHNFMSTLLERTKSIIEY